MTPAVTSHALARFFCQRILGTRLDALTLAQRAAWRQYIAEAASLPDSAGDTYRMTTREAVYVVCAGRVITVYTRAMRSISAFYSGQEAE